jgi:GT2 family glycosyltransferase
MAIRRTVFFEVGGFDERFFLYGEEEDLARRLTFRGLSTRLIPGAMAKHVGETSTAAVSAFATEQLFRSHVMMYGKHAGRRYAWFGAMVLSVALLLLIVTAPLRRITRWRKRETSRWCRAALRGVAAGLRGSYPDVPALGVTDGAQWAVDRRGRAHG